MLSGARRLADVEDVLSDISGDVHHTYLLTYRPAPAGDKGRRTIQLSVRLPQRVTILAIEGYFAD